MANSIGGDALSCGLSSADTEGVSESNDLDPSLLGQIVVREFGVTLRALQDALDEQKSSKAQLGDILVAAGALTSAQRDEALEIQAGRRLVNN
jgi:hypothetical protein